jgi:hypothetical protein
MSDLGSYLVSLSDINITICLHLSLVELINIVTDVKLTGV